MTEVVARPAFDPESAAPWLAYPGNDLSGRPTGLDAESLARVRRYAPAGQEVLLSGRQFTVKDFDVETPEGQMALSMFTPQTPRANAPGIYWIHGGGMVLGDRFGAGDALDIAEPHGAVVVSPEYRLAPDHPAPAPLDDAYAGLLWFVDHAEELGVDPGHLVLAGGSSGGGLAAAAALRLRDEGGPSVAGLVLLSPMLDDRTTSVSSRQFTDSVPWTRTSNAFGWRSLLGDRDGKDDVSIYEAPGRADDLAGLPPTFIDVGSADLFRDEDVAFASTIWACGGDAELHVWPGGYHGFEQMAPASTLAVTAVAARERWLGRLLGAVSR